MTLFFNFIFCVTKAVENCFLKRMNFFSCLFNQQKWLIVLKVVRPSEVRNATWLCQEKNIFIGEAVLSYFPPEKEHLLKLDVCWKKCHFKQNQKTNFLFTYREFECGWIPPPPFKFQNEIEILLNIKINMQCYSCLFSCSFFHARSLLSSAEQQKTKGPKLSSLSFC